MNEKIILGKAILKFIGCSVDEEQELRDEHERILQAAGIEYTEEDIKSARIVRNDNR